MAGLTRADFDVLDEGVAQHVELESLDQLPVDVTLALDMSDSVDGARLERLRAAGRAVLAGLKTDDKAGLVTFSHVVRLGAKLTDRQDVGTRSCRSGPRQRRHSTRRRHVRRSHGRRIRQRPFSAHRLQRRSRHSKLAFA